MSRGVLPCFSFFSVKRTHACSQTVVVRRLIKNKMKTYFGENFVGGGMWPHHCVRKDWRHHRRTNRNKVCGTNRNEQRIKSWWCFILFSRNRKIFYYWLRLFAMYRSFSIPLLRRAIVFAWKENDVARSLAQTKPNFLAYVCEEIFPWFSYTCHRLSCAGSVNIWPWPAISFIEPEWDWKSECMCINVEILKKKMSKRNEVSERHIEQEISVQNFLEKFLKNVFDRWQTTVKLRFSDFSWVSAFRCPSIAVPTKLKNMWCNFIRSCTMCSLLAYIKLYVPVQTKNKKQRGKEWWMYVLRFAPRCLAIHILYTLTRHNTCDIRQYIVL